MRYTKDAKTAITRVAESYELPPRPGKKTTIRRLAWFFDLLKRAHLDRDEVRDRIRWYGSIPLDGVSGWEREALEWGRAER